MGKDILDRIALADLKHYKRMYCWLDGYREYRKALAVRELAQNKLYYKPGKALKRNVHRYARVARMR